MSGKHTWTDSIGNLLPGKYHHIALECLSMHSSRIRSLLSNRRVPEQPWGDLEIRMLLNELAMMDSNNWRHVSRIGDREGRVYSRIVADRHFGLVHGIGRSGNVEEPQPKSIGSSLMLQLTKKLTLDFVKRLMGLKCARDLVILPVATGLAITLTLLTLKANSKSDSAKFVLWMRMDQKTCLKCISSAGLTPVVIENKIIEDEVVSDLDNLESQIEKVGSKNILCVISITSGFAPKAPDDVCGISKICKNHGIPHIVNNAFGLQSIQICKEISRAAVVGRVDAVIQSTDKNFMVPIGGSIVCDIEKGSFDVSSLANLYPGRASSSIVLDMFVTILSMAEQGWRNLVLNRDDLLSYMKDEIRKVSERNGERMLFTDRNPLSMAISLTSLEYADQDSVDLVGAFGSYLYRSGCSGARAVSTKSKPKFLCGIRFEKFGAHHPDYPIPYLTFSCTIGIVKADIDKFSKRLQKAFDSCRKKIREVC